MLKQWMKARLIALTVFGLLGFSTMATATVSEYTDFYVPYKKYQTEDICLSRQLMLAEFGIPLASIMTGIFSETRTLQQSLNGGGSYENINLLALPSTPIKWTYNFDRYHDNGITDYSFTLDFSAVNAANGNSVEGRQRTITLAKLAVVSIVRNAEQLHGRGKSRVWLVFQGVPNQDGLSGLPLVSGQTDWPTWPWSSSSVLYGNYMQELIGERCRP